VKFSEKTLFDSLYYSVDPYFSGLSGNKDAIRNLLKNLHVDESTTIEEIDKKTLKKLHSYLILLLLKKGCEKNIIDTVIRERYWSDMLNSELERFADLVDACGKGGNRGLALSLCIGDKDAITQAKIVEKNYKQKILDELLRIEKEGVKETIGLRYFYTTDSSLGGVIGGIATNFMLDTKKPLISLVRKDSEIHISSRGNQHLVEKGLDLGAAMNAAAKKLGGHGGGHKIAAGATIDSDKENEFLQMVDSIIKEQLKVE
jgi:RecJ-like exonuclease